MTILPTIIKGDNSRGFSKKDRHQALIAIRLLRKYGQNLSTHQTHLIFIE